MPYRDGHRIVRRPDIRWCDRPPCSLPAVPAPGSPCRDVTLGSFLWSPHCDACVDGPVILSSTTPTGTSSTRRDRGGPQGLDNICCCVEGGKARRPCPSLTRTPLSPGPRVLPGPFGGYGHPARQLQVAPSIPPHSGGYTRRPPVMLWPSGG